MKKDVMKEVWKIVEAMKRCQEDDQCDGCPLADACTGGEFIQAPKTLLEKGVEVIKAAMAENERLKAENDKSYYLGREAAWEVAKRIMCRQRDGGLKYDELKEIFSFNTINDIFARYPIKEVMDELDEYDRKKKIRIGDEVTVQGERLIVCYACDQYILGTDGEKNFQGAPDSFVKTGRHFDQLDDAFALLKKGEGECSS